MSVEIIDAVEVIDCSALVGPGDDGYAVAVHSSGVTGWFAPVAGPAAALVASRLGPAAVGVPVSDHDALHQRLCQATGERIGTVASWAIGALDCAVWDLHGRRDGCSVADLLDPGGAHDTVPAYASWLRLDVDTDPASVQGVAGEGWQFTKWGLRSGAGARASTEATRLASLVSRVGELVGAAAAFDALWTWDVDLVREFADVVDLSRLMWLEEPLTTHDSTLYAALPRFGLPLAVGERVSLDDESRSLTALPELVAFTVDPVGCGGITTAIRLIATARDAGVPVYPHGRSLVPALHLAAAFSTVVPAVEFQVQWEPRRQRMFTEPLRWHAGRVHLPEAPGLGPVPRSA